jgi:hypothetical protein
LRADRLLPRVRGQVDELFACDQPLAEVPEQVACLRIRLVLQAALEAEVSGFLGRAATSATLRPGPACGHLLGGGRPAAPVQAPASAAAGRGAA